MGPDQRSQLLRALERDRREHAFVLAAGGRTAGFELDPGDPEQAGERALADVDVLDAVERDRAVGAAENAAVDADFVGADSKLEAGPVEEQAAGDEGEQGDRRDQRRRSPAGN